MLLALPPIAEQVRRELDALGKSVRWLAIQAGINHQSLAAWFNEDYSPRDDKVWGRLLAVLREHRDSLSARPPIVREPGSVYAPVVLDRPRIPVGYPMAAMRYAGEVPCSSEWGDPLASEEFIEVEVQFEGARRFAARVVGDSCYPALQPGDVTVWEQDLSPPYGTIVLAQRKGDHGCTVKQLTHDGQRPHLTPVNPSYGEPGDEPGWGVAARLVAVLRPGPTRRTWFSEFGLKPRDLTELS